MYIYLLNLFYLSGQKKYLKNDSLNLNAPLLTEDKEDQTTTLERKS
jgi:hypothetical protein